MVTGHLRVYHGPQTEAVDSVPEEHTITCSLGQILPLLVDAARSDRTWLRDFSADPVTISTDLYEVLLAYQHFRRPSA